MFGIKTNNKNEADFNIKDYLPKSFFLITYTFEWKVDKFYHKIIPNILHIGWFRKSLEII